MCNDGRGQQYQGDLPIVGAASGPQAGRTLKYFDLKNPGWLIS
jgi:hypothetical protein